MSPPQTAKIYVTDVNEAPTNLVFDDTVHTTLTGDNLIKMREDKALLNWNVARLSAQDPDIYATDASWNTLEYFFKTGINTFSKVSPDGRYKITGSIIEVAASSLDFENSADRLNTYTISVKDEAGGYDASQDRDLSIRITNFDDELPTISLAIGISKPIENGPAGHLVMDVNASDPDNIRTAFTYEIASGNVGGVFNIDNQGRVTVQGALDYESRSSYALKIKVTENDSNQTHTKNYTVNVLDGDDLIAFVRPSERRFVDLSTEAISQGYTKSTTFTNSGFQITDASTAFKNQSGAQIGTHFSSYTAATIFRSDMTSAASGYYIDVNAEMLFRSAGAAFPIVLDLDGDGVEITPISYQLITFDIDNDGSRQRTDWVGADDGLLVLDRNGDGVIDNGAEISFVDDLPGATTDLEGLVAFDTNADGVFDAADARFAEFQIWQDANQDGVSRAGELMSLKEAGIQSLDLTPTPTGINIGDPVDALILNTATFARMDGSTGVAGDVVFRYSTREEAPAPGAPEPLQTENAPALGAQADKASTSDPSNNATKLEVMQVARPDLQALFDDFLGKMEGGELTYELPAVRDIAIDTRQDAFSTTVHDAKSATSLNRLIDAMASFNADRYGVGSRYSDRHANSSGFADIAMP